MVLIDLSRLYFAVRDLRLSLNYARLLHEITENMEEPVIAFTVSSAKNTQQVKFLNKLRGYGVDLIECEFNTPSNFSIEIIAAAAIAEDQFITVVSNDGALVRPFNILRAHGKCMKLCFFSERLDGVWMPLILNGNIPLIDLSEKELKARITA